VTGSGKHAQAVIHAVSGFAPCAGFLHARMMDIGPLGNPNLVPGSARYKSLLLKKFSLQSIREFPVRLLSESGRKSLNLLVVRARKIEQRA
jgi:hypothetical protein